MNLRQDVVGKTKRLNRKERKVTGIERGKRKRDKRLNRKDRKLSGKERRRIKRETRG